MDETILQNYLKGESDAEECLEVEAWYHASAEHKKQLDQLYYMLFVGERKVAMDGVDTENSLSVLKDRIKHKESEKKSVHRIRVSKWKRYAMPLAAFLCGLLVLFPVALRGMVYSTVPMILSIIGTVGVRIIWIYGLFPSHRSLTFLFLSYPVSWIATIIMQVICFWFVRKKIHRTMVIAAE